MIDTKELRRSLTMQSANHSYVCETTLALEMLDELDRLAARVKELEAAQTLRPIETAPEKTFVLVCHYDPDSERALFAGRVIWRMAYLDEYKRWFSRKGLMFGGCYGNPTHWLPLPPAPKET